MTEIRYWVADDGTKFEYEYDCIQYERKKKLEEFKDDFVLYDSHMDIIPFENADCGNISIMVIKSFAVAEYIRKWFNDEGYCNPFCDCEFGQEIGTWVYGDMINEGDEWIKLEDKIEKLQNLIDIINK